MHDSIKMESLLQQQYDLDVKQRLSATNGTDRQRDDQSSSYTLEQSIRIGPNDPRSLPQPFNLESPLPDTFNLWPPTPRTAGGRPATIHESTFSTYPLNLTAPSALPASSMSSWAPLTSQSVMSSSLAVPSQYSTASGDMEGYLPALGSFESLEDSWDKARGSYSSMLQVDDMQRIGSTMSTDSDSYLDTSYGSMDDERVGRSLTRQSTESYDMSHSSSEVSYDDSQFDQSMMSDYTRRTTPMSMSNAPLSPIMPSPCGSNRMSIRPASRKASPSPRPRSRIAPYSTTDSTRSKRWSTGSYFAGNNFNALMPPVDTLSLQQPISSHHSSPVCGPHPHSHPHGPVYAHNPYMLPTNPPYLPSSTYLPSNYDPMETMMHPSFARILHSSDPHHAHYSDLSDPPDLYAALREEQSMPPPEDMDPEDPEAKPHEQPGRFDGDLYTPKYVRFNGNRREGWCGICKPGRWLVLKNSAFWYDKSFTHGVSAATGQSFLEPTEMRRMDGNPDVWEGLCHSCSDWVPLVSNKKKGTAWFRHAYKVCFAPL